MSSTAAPSSPRSGRPQVSSRDALVEAGLELIDERGATALSMRGIAARLGISAMTPYNYFADKAELREAITEHGLAALAHDTRSQKAWDRELEDAMQGLRAALTRHPGILELLLDRSTQTMGGFRRELIEMLQNAGFSERDAADALRTLGAYVIGYALLERGNPGAGSFDRGLRMLLDQIRLEMA
jgi:AcrR family transcriptional regulator